MTNTLDVTHIRQTVINGLAQIPQAQKLFKNGREMRMFSEDLCPSLVTPNAQTYKTVLTDDKYCILVIVDNVADEQSPIMAQICKNI